jgi:hypothetical protein
VDVEIVITFSVDDPTNGAMESVGVILREMLPYMVDNVIIAAREI